MDVRECPYVEPPFPDELVGASRALLRQTLDFLPDDARLLAGMALARFPHHAEQLAAGAEVLTVTETDLMLGTLSYDLAMGFGCSTLALATADGPVLARNMDWAPEAAIARASCLLPLDDGRTAGFAGTVGVVTALSYKGFAVALNAVPTDAPNMNGYPMLLFLRHLVDTAEDFGHAVRLASDTPLSSSGLLTLVGSSNDQRVLVERTPTRFRLVRPEGDAPLVTTNHYRAIEQPDTCSRFDRASGRAAGLAESPTDEALLGVLTDPGVLQSITAQHVVARPAAGLIRMWVPGHLVR